MAEVAVEPPAKRARAEAKDFAGTIKTLLRAGDDMQLVGGRRSVADSAILETLWAWAATEQAPSIEEMVLIEQAEARAISSYLIAPGDERPSERLHAMAKAEILKSLS